MFKIDQILRLIVIAIVLMVAFSLLGFILKIGSALLSIGFKILMILLVIAIILRFIAALRRR